MATASLPQPVEYDPRIARTATGSWADRARAVPSSLPPFWIVCGLTLIVAHYQLWGRVNLAYKGLGVAVVAMMIVSAGFSRMISRPAVLWLLGFQAVMVVNMAMGRFYDISALFTTSSPPVVLLRSLPMLLCGYTLAKYPARERTFLLAVAAAYWLMCVPDFFGFISGAQGGLDRAQQQIETQGLGSDINVKEWARAYISCFIYFAPLLLFFAIELFRIYPNLSKPMRMVVMLIQATFVTTAVLSGFGAVVLMAGVAVVLFGIFAPVKSLGYRMRWLALSAVSLGIMDLVRQAFFASDVRSAAGQAFAKAASIVTALFYREEGVDLIEQMSFGSSSRSVLLWQSIETFLRHPIVGFGFQEDMTEVGGHSFFFDAAASFGIVGAIPAVAFFATLAVALSRARKRVPGSWPLAASTIFLWTLMLGLVINPYLLEMLSLSYFLFLFLGFALADAEAVPDAPRPALRQGA
jgi:hypothetical protein